MTNETKDFRREFPRLIAKLCRARGKEWDELAAETVDISEDIFEAYLSLIEEVEKLRAELEAQPPKEKTDVQ